jgi:hypothetical protein
VDAGDIEEEEFRRAMELSMQAQPQPARGYGADDAGLGGGGCGGGGQNGSYFPPPAPARNDDDMFLNVAMEQSLREAPPPQALPGEDFEAVMQRALRESLEGQPVNGGGPGDDEALQRALEESEREAAAVMRATTRARGRGGRGGDEAP